MEPDVPFSGVRVVVINMNSLYTYICGIPIPEPCISGIATPEIEKQIGESKKISEIFRF